MGEDGVQGGSWFVPSSIHPLFHSQLSPSADLAVAVFLTFTGVLSVLGNGTVLLVCSRKRKKLKPPELMTINLAICDFGFSLLGTPFFIISSLCHAWVFGETGCLWYGIQGFVFGIGSLLTTCLISVDRCLKICSLRYGQWVERRHVFVSIVLLWVYTLFWAFLPVFGFGNYGPEPYGTSCTISWWRMRSSLTDRIYVFLILTLCFGFPSLIIITSYLSILMTVYRSNRTLASISSSSVTHSSKDLRLAKMAAVVCATFLAAWTPYATVSLISALVPKDEQKAEGMLQTAMEDSTAAASNSPSTAGILDVPSLFNWTYLEFYRKTYHSPENKWRQVNNMSSASMDNKAEQMTQGPQAFSSLPPVVTLIPAMFAKSHCMINPLIYQIMNREFRDAVYEMVFGQEMAERKRTRRRKESLFERSASLNYSQSWRRKKSSSTSVSGEIRHIHRKKQKNQLCGKGTDSWYHNKSVDLAKLYTERNIETAQNQKIERSEKVSTAFTIE